MKKQHKSFKDKSRRLIEIALEESQKKYQDLIETTSDFIWELDCHGIYTYCSPQVEKLWGIKPAQLVGISPFDVILPDDREKIIKDFNELVNSPATFAGVVTRAYVNQGSLVYVETSGVPFFDKKGRLAGFRGISRDITKRKRAEMEVFEARQRLQALMKALPIGVSFSDDPSCQHITGNDVLFEQFEIKTEDNISASAPDANTYGRKVRYFINGREISDEELPLQRAVKEKKATGVMELEILLPSGKRWFASASGAPIYSESGDVLGGVAVTVDITERKQCEEILMRDKNTFEKLVMERTNQLVEAQLELERSKHLSDIGVLAATVAHELRNPLAAIGMAAHNVRRKALTPDIDKHLANIDKKVAESGQIINNLLFYSRLKPPQYEKVNIYEILDESVESNKEKIKKGIRIIKDIKSLKYISIEADPVQIKEVFNNILNNAYDAVSADGGEIKILSETADSLVRVIIKDNGCGINKEILDKVFDPFFTTKAKGTGLGLAVCRQIIGFHEGSIVIESMPGHGTTVAITLPAKRKPQYNAYT